MKRKLVSFRRICKSGAQNFFRNAWLSVAATAVMIVALVIILSSIVLNVAAQNAITELSKNLKISVYIKTDAKQTDITRLQNELSGNQYVASVTYITTDQAQQQFNESFGSDQKLIEGLALVGGNTLPASFEISVNNLSKFQEVGDIPKQQSYAATVDSISLGKTDAKKTIDRAASAQKFITLASIIAAAVFAIVSMLIIFNTIRMAIFTRSEEIKIMKLVGATPSYIAGPFLVEACMYGIISGTIAASIVVGAVYYLGDKIGLQAEFIQTYNYFTEPKIIAVMYAGTILAGILIGVISSMFAMEKYLKLKSW
jgi:cell division transport system permease protein